VPLTGIAPGSLVVVRSGNSLWRIARRTYGTGFKYTVIYDANRNQIKNQDLIYPGQVFALPSIN
jgi:nucleoid-associated protein YgaU